MYIMVQRQFLFFSYRGNYDLQSVKSLKALHSKLAEFLETTPEDDENDRGS